MRSQTYGDKQREAQRRKKEEERLKNSKPQDAPASQTPMNVEKPDQESNKSGKKDKPSRQGKH